MAKVSGVMHGKAVFPRSSERRRTRQGTEIAKRCVHNGSSNARELKVVSDQTRNSSVSLQEFTAPSSLHDMKEFSPTPDATRPQSGGDACARPAPSSYRSHRRRICKKKKVRYRTERENIERCKKKEMTDSRDAFTNELSKRNVRRKDKHRRPQGKLQLCA